MKVAVVGAGVIGICTALKIQELGHDVYLLDRCNPGKGCSFGSAGVLTGSVTGITAYPGILRDLPTLLFSGNSPLSVRWQYIFRIIPWLHAFIKASRKDLNIESIEALSVLVNSAADSYEDLINGSKADRSIRKNGVLQVYLSTKAFKKADEERILRKKQGEDPFIMSRSEARAFAPALGNNFSGALYRPDVPSLTDPYEFVTALFNYFLFRGGNFIHLNVKDLEHLKNDRWLVRGVIPNIHQDLTQDILEIEADILVICAGAWSKSLIQKIGLSPLLDTERGYHVCLTRGKGVFDFPVLVADRGFFMSPMKEGLRLAGTVELGGLDNRQSERGCEFMVSVAQSLVPDLDTSIRRRWLGFRPSMPNSVPVIGAIPGKKNAFAAFGHGHLGLTLAAVSGEIIARRIALGDSTHKVSDPYRFR